MWSVVGGQPELSSVRFQQGQRQLLGRLMMHHKQATTDPRDRILALRGLSKIDEESFWDQQDEKYGSPMWMYKGPPTASTKMLPATLSRRGPWMKSCCTRLVLVLYMTSLPTKYHGVLVGLGNAMRTH
jgi:hypothetical protein